MYYQVENLVEYYGWTVKQAKELTVRERKHWFKRSQARRESPRKQ